jgi:hypothetical protein
VGEEQKGDKQKEERKKEEKENVNFFLILQVSGVEMLHKLAPAKSAKIFVFHFIFTPLAPIPFCLLQLFHLL